MRAVTSPAQRQWLAATKPVGFTDDVVVLATPHDFARSWLENRCGELIREALSTAAGRPLTVVITVQPKPEPVGDLTAADTSLSGPSPAPSTSPAGPADAGGPSLDSPEDAEPPAGRHHRPSPPSLRDEVERPAWRDEPERIVDRAAERATDTWPDTARPDDERPLQAPGRPPGPTVQLPEPRPRVTEDVEPDTQLNPKYSFDDFVIGSSNRFAHAAAVAVSEAPAKSYNPLFIYGGAGLGKTHLLHAIGHYVRNLYPRLSVRYVTTEQFTNEFINAIRDDRITGFQRLYRQADVLLIDDIQFLERKERTQEEFFHTFNALHNAEKQIVISSDRPPKQIAQLEDRLRSRFEWGLMTDVQPPDLETRIAILRKKCESDRLGVPPDVLELIASKVQSNIRELEGALIRVSAFASLQQAPPDSAMAEVVLKDLFPDDREQEVNVSLIMDEVADFFSLTTADLCSPSRNRQLVTARQIAMYLARELTELSLPVIGKAFGGRDHTTVMHANKKIAGLMQERRAIYDQVQELTNRIKTRARRP
ncbi:chromosomal replication initiator protein DnaA [Nitriliruptoraceae bacterium ZYF776]|nr:chromosomal replication initiator protein DnaA [Profundirhabdus halotolerans]